MLSAIKSYFNYRTPAPAKTPATPAKKPLAKATTPVKAVPPPPKPLVDDGIHHLRGRQWHTLQPLLTILGLNRCADGPGIDVAVASCLEGLPGAIQDSYGNWFLSINQRNGDAPEVLFTSHLDSVSRDKESIWHPLRYNLEKDVLFRNNTHCLGADCGTGVWLMLEMIKSRVPGLYAFYMDEETGREGSLWSHKNNPERYRDIDRVISFDRKGKTDIVGTQRGRRCCSDLFQKALAELLGMGYKTHAQGSFTDSATFMDDTPECTNISVGYYDQHTTRETQHVGHALALCERLIAIGQGFHDLPVGRVPTPPPPPAPYAPGTRVNPPYNPNPYHRSATSKQDADEWDRYLEELETRDEAGPRIYDDPWPSLDELIDDLMAMSTEQIIEEHSDFVVELLNDFGIYHEDLCDYIADQLDTLAIPKSTTH